MAFTDLGKTIAIANNLKKYCTPSEQFEIANSLISNLVDINRLKGQLGFVLLLNNMMEVHQSKIKLKCKHKKVSEQPIEPGSANFALMCNDCGDVIN